MLNLHGDEMIRLNLDPVQIELVAMNPPTRFTNIESESHYSDNIRTMAMGNINLWIKMHLQGRGKAWFYSDDEHLLVDLETPEDVDLIRKFWIGL